MTFCAAVSGQLSRSAQSVAHRSHVTGRPELARFERVGVRQVDMRRAVRRTEA
jgi:hypothetical protein